MGFSVSVCFRKPTVPEKPYFSNWSLAMVLSIECIVVPPGTSGPGALEGEQDTIASVSIIRKARRVNLIIIKTIPY
jgi:hypothetical protein